MTITGGEAVLRALEANGVRHLFGIPGNHALPIFDALNDSPIEFIQVRHEQSAAYMADAYARVTGRPGVLATITGPGALNTAAALGNAYYDSSPVVAIASNVPRTSLYRSRGMLHESRDQFGAFQSISKWAGRAMTASEIPERIDAAFRQVLNGRPRPAYVEIPSDVLFEKADFELPLPPASHSRAAADPVLIESAAARIREARRPIIWAGGGVNRAGAEGELLLVAELLGAPVITTTQGRGAFPGSHPLAVRTAAGDRPLRDWIAGHDLVLAVATRFTQEATATWRTRLPRMLIHIDADIGEIGKNYPTALGIPADAKLALGQLFEALRTSGVTPSSDRRREIAEVNDRALGYYRGLMPREVEVMDGIRAATPSDAVVVCDSTRAGYWTAVVTPFDHARTLVYPSYYTVGGGFASAIGAAIGRPGVPVLAIVGDGGFQYTFPELATAALYGVPLVVLLVNDREYGIVAEGMQARYGRRTGTDLSTNPDFQLIARAYGLRSVALESWDGIEQALKDAFAARRFTLLEVREGLRTPPWSWGEG